MNSNNITLNSISWIFPKDVTKSSLSRYNQSSIFQYIKKVDTLPLFDNRIKFSDDVWDFKDYVLERVPKRKVHFNYNKTSPFFKELSKSYTLYMLWKDTLKIQTIYTYVSRLNVFFNFLDANNIYSIEYLSLSTLKLFFSEKLSTIQPETIESYKNIIKSFYEFYNYNVNKFEWGDIYSYLSEFNFLACSSQRENNKWSTIPDEYMENLLPLLIDTMDNPLLPIDHRGISAMIILFSQTGLRYGELTDCPYNGMKTMSILNNTKQTYYLEYYTTKNCKGNMNKRLVHSFLTDLGYKAFSSLKDIYKESRSNKNSNLLFVPIRSKTLPVTDTTIDRLFQTLLLYYHDKIDCINVRNKYPKLKTVTLESFYKNNSVSMSILNKLNPTDELTLPRPHQFRVYLCNQLFKQGIPLIFIKEHMNHLEKEMTLSYTRNDNKESQSQYSYDIMQSIVNDEIKILGDKADTLNEKIKEFISKSNLKIDMNIDSITNKLIKNFPIRAKSGGLCIKSGPIRECKNSDITDELFCSYGICPNSFHVYFMLDINYNKCKILTETMKHNKNKGFIKAYEKEKGKLKSIVDKIVIPELNELRVMIDKKGSNNIIKEHSNLEYFVNNYDSVYKEVMSWIK